MADRLDELLSRGLTTLVDVDSTDERGRNLGSLIRFRAARRDRARRTALLGAAAVILLSGTAVLLQNRNRDSDNASKLAHARTQANDDNRKLTGSPNAQSDLQVAMIIDELSATTQLVHETIERMQSDERTRQLRRQLSQYETRSTLDLAMDQTVAIGLADAHRIAAVRPEEATQRLTRLVALFPESSLAVQARQQLNELHMKEAMP